MTFKKNLNIDQDGLPDHALSQANHLWTAGTEKVRGTSQTLQEDRPATGKRKYLAVLACWRGPPGRLDTFLLNADTRDAAVEFLRDVVRDEHRTLALIRMCSGKAGFDEWFQDLDLTLEHPLLSSGWSWRGTVLDLLEEVGNDITVDVDPNVTARRQQMSRPRRKWRRQAVESTSGVPMEAASQPAQSKLDKTIALLHQPDEDDEVEAFLRQFRGSVATPPCFTCDGH